MSYLSDLLMDARRRAMISGMPLTNQETEGIIASGSAGAGERALRKKQLADELERQRRMKEMAKKQMAQQDKANTIEAAGNIYSIDKMTGGHLGKYTYSPLIDAAETGAENLAAKAMPNLYARLTKTNTPEGALRVANNLKSLGSTLVPNAGLTTGSTLMSQLGTQAAPMTMAANAGATTAANTARLMGQLGVNSAPMTLAPAAGQLAAQTGTQALAGQTAGQVGAQTATQATGQGLGAMTGKLVGSALPVINIIGAADAVRNLGGGLDKPYADASFAQKTMRTPVMANVPGVLGLPSGAGETALADKVLGENNPISKVNNFLGKMEEKTVGEPLDKIFGAVGKTVKKIFCHAEGTKFRMADGTVKDVSEIKIGDEMLEGGRVFATGQCEQDDIWSYNGNKVAGSHCVLENDRWVRVKDSHLGKPLDIEKIVVYPICNENHWMISEDGTVWADFAETDQGTGVNDRERLDYMNQQLDEMEYLRERYAA